MNKKHTLLTIFAGAILSAGMPVVDVSAYAPASNSLTKGVPVQQISVRIGQPRRRFRHKGRWYTGYRNYGQFRRTQVGNRRYSYRTFPEYYWDDGIRRVRYVRYYYYYDN